MTYNVFGGTLNLAQLNPNFSLPLGADWRSYGPRRVHCTAYSYATAAGQFMLRLIVSET